MLRIAPASRFATTAMTLPPRTAELRIAPASRFATTLVLVPCLSVLLRIAPASRFATTPFLQALETKANFARSATKKTPTERAKAASAVAFSRRTREFGQIADL
jgi:hypothetical protein